MNTTPITDPISRLDDPPEATDEEWYGPSATRRRHHWPQLVYVDPDVERLTDEIHALRRRLWK